MVISEIIRKNKDEVIKNIASTFRQKLNNIPNLLPPLVLGSNTIQLTVSFTRSAREQSGNQITLIKAMLTDADTNYSCKVFEKEIACSNSCEKEIADRLKDIAREEFFNVTFDPAGNDNNNFSSLINWSEKEE